MLIKYFYTIKTKKESIDEYYEYYDKGDKKWYRNNKYHRIDGPSSEYADGDLLWFYNGKFIARNSTT